MSAAHLHPAYGVGLRFPLASPGPFARVEGAAAVEQAIRTLLLTEPGERVGRPDYGCGLRRFVFAPNDVATRTLIRETVVSALRRHEPRIALAAVDVRSTDDDTRVDIHVSYRLVAPEVAAGDPRNLVFPFHLDERGA